MTDTLTISKARKQAKLLARQGSQTHQQALESIARGAGFGRWRDMLHASGTATADASFPATSCEASHPAAIESVPEHVLVSQWIAGRPSHPAMPTTSSGVPSLVDLRMTADVVAYAMDPSGGPYDRVDALVVRCPCHRDSSPSLSIRGRHAVCLSGCDDDRVAARLHSRLVEAAEKAVSFIALNASDPVVYGASASSRGGMGGEYRFASGRRRRLGVLSGRMLPDEFPSWQFSG